MSKQKSLTTYLNEDDELYQAVTDEAERRRLSKADMLRQILQEWHERQAPPPQE